MKKVENHCLKRTFTSTTANEVQDIQDFDNSRIFTEKIEGITSMVANFHLFNRSI